MDSKVNRYPKESIQYRNVKFKELEEIKIENEMRKGRRDLSWKQIAIEFDINRQKAEIEWKICSI